MKSSTSVRAVTSATDDLHREIGELLFDMMRRTRDHALVALADLDLTMAQGMALHHLDQPRRMRELADEMGFDASHITGIVDRLEARGLVERRPDPADRRVKLLVITDEGRELRRTVEEDVFRFHPVLSRLTPAQCRDLRDLLGQLVTSDGDDGDGGELAAGSATGGERG